MTSIDRAAAGSDGLQVRPPLQRRSREAWARVLDAGVALVEHGGYEAFTIAAVCERAQIAPRAIYDRVDTKDALFLAVYEHGLARVRADQGALVDLAERADLRGERLAEAVVDVLVELFGRHRRLLRAVVLISGAHPEVTRRGAIYSRELGEQFTAVMLRHPADIDAAVHAGDPATATRAVFAMVFAALVFRTAYGAGFTDPPEATEVGDRVGDQVDDQAFSVALSRMVSRYLFGR